MSIYRPLVQPETRQALHRRKTALTARLRENWQLKVISLAAAVCLYVFIQSDRNPTITQDYTIEVKYRDVPEHTEVDPPQHLVTFNISGPKMWIDKIKTPQIDASVSLTGKPLNRELTYSDIDLNIPSLSKSQVQQLTIEKPPLRLRIMEVATRQLDVSLAHKPNAPGYQFGSPIFYPTNVNITGWQERVRRVARVVVDDVISPDFDRLTHIKADYQADYAVHAYDANDQLVSNIQIIPSMVHVSFPVTVDPPTRFATVSAELKPLPNPPYFCTSVSVQPNRVKLTGKIDNIFTIQTDQISLKNETQPRDFEVNLRIPDGCKVTDEKNNPIDRVTVHVMIKKSTSALPHTNGTEIPLLPPVDPNG